MTLFSRVPDTGCSNNNFQFILYNRQIIFERQVIAKKLSKFSYIFFKVEIFKENGKMLSSANLNYLARRNVLNNGSKKKMNLERKSFVCYFENYKMLIPSKVIRI